ncbi:MAG TPA: transcription-repair coupling factor [Limnochordia bacterium]|nr:transcription-repair coupling factor [Limnochordia bacterium]
MSLQGLVNLVSQSQDVSHVRAAAARGEKLLALGLSGSQRSLLTAALANDRAVILFIGYNQYQVETIGQDLHNLLPNRNILVFTPHELLPHEEATIDWELRKSRLEVLKACRRPGSVICASVQALSEALPDPDLFFRYQITIDMDTRVDTEALARQLSVMGYERVDMVEAFGQFSIRGGIIDIYDFTAEHPVRIELFDDEIDSIRLFSIDSQRSIENIQEVTIFPARERLFVTEDREAVKDQIWQDAQDQGERLINAGLNQEADSLLAKTANHLVLLDTGNYFPGIDQYLPYTARIHTLIDYLPQDSLIIVSEPARVKEHHKLFLQDVGETVSGLLAKGRILPRMAEMFVDWDGLWPKIYRHRHSLYLSVLDSKIPDLDAVSTYQFQIRSAPHFHTDLDGLVDQLQRYRKQYYRILILVSTEERGAKLVEFLKEHDIPAQYTDEVGDKLKAGNCIVTKGALENGMEYAGFKLLILTELEIYGKKRAKRRVNRTEAQVRLTESDLKPGDYVIHVNHGIGQYMGIETLEVQKTHKDFLLIRFAGKDRLYVPTDQIGLLQRYVGLDDEPPKLSRLGGGEWARVKSRVKESVQDLAEGLIKLYAERETIEGFAFPEDTPWQAQFEDEFPYEETPDQIRAIAEVKRDMENKKPMDRLLCGDVGYGKTEVAIRAAFKAISAGKQVAVLVPTTILAQQHARTFQERFEDYPVKIGVLSRFQSPAEQKKVISGLRSGTVDLVIGTHRLLSKDVTYRDLGLVVVDEEQRFGVAQKEKLKELARNVDVLTLSATPIPRTLHMALVGVRDMSLIETPPEDRFPIRTYVLEWDDQAIAQAIHRELGRQGQVYFVYNRIQGIDNMFLRLQDLVPEARIAVAHGQMDENRLEQVMLDFYHGEYDILLCTTIIETGMDISNVNTLVVYDADRLGLAQLYQLRGRVGRTNRVAYAYFTYRRDKILTEDAEKRLQAIKEFSDLGSGIKIAMRDLEIRGAGNILGPEQHGFITSVGFELYCKLLEEAIEKLKGKAKQQIPDPVLDLQVDAYIGDRYVPDPKQKVELYKKLAAVQTLEDADELALEIEDRFGELPDPVRNLVLATRIKVLARQAGIASVFLEKGMFVIRSLPGIIRDREKYAALVRQFRGQVGYLPGSSPQIKVKVKGLSDYEALLLLQKVLQSLL